MSHHAITLPKEVDFITSNGPRRQRSLIFPSLSIASHYTLVRLTLKSNPCGDAITLMDLFQEPPPVLQRLAA